MAATKEEVIVDKRSFAQVVYHDLVNYIYFFTPLVIAHNVAWAVKPWLTEDPRGPWEILWHGFLDTTTSDRYTLFVYGTVMVTTFCYWLTAGLYMLMDYTQKPGFLMKYKIQEGKNTPPNTAKTIKVILTVLFNQSLAIPASMIHFKEWEKQSNPDVRYVPTTFDTFVTLMICMLGHDFVFYHGHKLLHHRSIYKYIHKKHHEWQAPIAAAAEYAHPVEHAITGLFSASLGLIITAAPIPVFWLWFTWLGFQVQNDHSGYHFPLMFSPEFHDYHHLKFHTSYGWLSFWDWFWGTDIEFQRTTVHKNRHFRLHTTKSAREIVPDEKKSQ